MLLVCVAYFETDVAYLETDVAGQCYVLGDGFMTAI